MQGLLVPRRTPVAKAAFVRLVPDMETKLLGWERPFMGLLSHRESPCVTCGSAIGSPCKAFGWERASMGLLVALYGNKVF